MSFKGLTLLCKLAQGLNGLCWIELLRTSVDAIENRVATENPVITSHISQSLTRDAITRIQHSLECFEQSVWTDVTLIETNHLSGSIAGATHDALLSVIKRFVLLGTHAEFFLREILRRYQPGFNTQVLFPESSTIYN